MSFTLGVISKFNFVKEEGSINSLNCSISKGKSQSFIPQFLFYILFYKNTYYNLLNNYFIYINYIVILKASRHKQSH